MRTSTTALTVSALALAATALAPGLATAAAPPTLGACAKGELCLWSKQDFKGARHVYELSGTDIESCTALPAGVSASSLANRTGRPVTTYQSAECAETGEFQTYPGTGTYEPESPYRVRAFKIWES
ncbi:peptidase inhibitor family I36 protein [Streptomyces sp. NPDC050145]|uniref:peptidase inhibitor family I36 protein n=1 Tax=Streptomyces sp. NPDC050145 TaxID=3365602 RepID=UPI0037BA790C